MQIMNDHQHVKPDTGKPPPGGKSISRRVLGIPLSGHQHGRSGCHRQAGLIAHTALISGMADALASQPAPLQQVLPDLSLVETGLCGGWWNDAIRSVSRRIA